MKIFISWSGGLSQSVATTLRKYLPCMIQGLSVFMSKHDLESGVRWATQLARELEDSTFGVLCLTPANLTSPWLLFEAGALTKHMEGRACGLLLQGLSHADVGGPLAQFQHRLFTQEDILGLLQDMNSKVESSLKVEQLQMVFDKWWPDISAEYDVAVKAMEGEVVAPAGRSDREILEEVLELSRIGVETHVTGGQAADKLIRYIIGDLSTETREVLRTIVALKRAGDDGKVRKYVAAHPSEVSELVALRIAQKSGGSLRLHRYFFTFEF